MKFPETARRLSEAMNDKNIKAVELAEKAGRPRHSELAEEAARLERLIISLEKDLNEGDRISAKVKRDQAIELSNDINKMQNAPLLTRRTGELLKRYATGCIKWDACDLEELGEISINKAIAEDLIDRYTEGNEEEFIRQAAECLE